MPVLLVTVLAAACEEWALSLGAAGFLRKPVQTDKMLAAAEAHCR